MNSVVIAALAIAGASVGFAKVAVGAMIQEEARTRLNRIPLALIRLAITRVRFDLRADLAAEWSAELEFVLSDTEGMPLTRLWRGVCYSTGLLLCAHVITNELTDSNALGMHQRSPISIRTEMLYQSDPDDMLTWRQRKILQVIEESLQRRGCPPSIREIGEALGTTSTGSVTCQLSFLQSKGYLRLGR